MIEVTGLTKNYNDFCAVNKIDFKVKTGEILGLLGPNGAGKTTTLRMLTGFFEPSHGDIEIKDFKIPQDTLQIKKLIGYLPESAPLYHNMLVFDYLVYIARIKGIEEDRIDDRLNELSSLCGLSEIMHKPIAELSKGLNQRVGLAHAMISDPEILILDEPTSGLDPNQIVEIRKIIKNIGKEKTIILSTHILSEAEATCDRILIIDKGKIVADDTPENLKKSAKNESFITLSLYDADASEAMEYLQSIDDNMIVETDVGSDNEAISFKIKISGLDNPMKKIYLKIKETDWIISEFKKESQSLENIFHKLTNGD
ncbi:MAG: ATP-binding cassette domain-containing protein [Desulfobacteraceae bacterium]|nr:ATP-binding cassette domain-containing protein [Desulfobacteraceae bacterium]